MRPFEILLILVVIAAALALMAKSAVRYFAWGSLLHLACGRRGHSLADDPRSNRAYASCTLAADSCRSSNLPLPGDEASGGRFDRSSLIGKLCHSSPGAHVFSSKANGALSCRNSDRLSEGLQSR